RALMMGAVSEVEEYSYDGTGRPGIFWQKSRDSEFEVWTPVGAPGNATDFSVHPSCADGSAQPCSTPLDSGGRVRPVPALWAGTAGDLDVLFNGPGPVLADSLLTNDGLAFEAFNLASEQHSIPVVGSYASGIADQLLFYRPGPEEDALLMIDD